LASTDVAQKADAGHTVALELLAGQYVPLEHVDSVADDEPVGQ
jgi:hypothetical protein